MRPAVLAGLLAVVSLLLPEALSAQQRNRTPSSAPTAPDKIIVDAAFALRKDVNITREQRDTLAKIDSAYVTKEQTIKNEALFMTRIPSRAATAQTWLGETLMAMHKDYAALYRAVLDSTQAVTFDKNLAANVKKLEETLLPARRGRGEEHPARD